MVEFECIKETIHDHKWHAVHVKGLWMWACLCVRSACLAFEGYKEAATFLPFAFSLVYNCWAASRTELLNQECCAWATLWWANMFVLKESYLFSFFCCKKHRSKVIILRCIFNGTLMLYGINKNYSGRVCIVGSKRSDIFALWYRIRQCGNKSKVAETKQRYRVGFTAVKCVVTLSKWDKFTPWCTLRYKGKASKRAALVHLLLPIFIYLSILQEQTSDQKPVWKVANINLFCLNKRRRRHEIRCFTCLLSNADKD